VTEAAAAAGVATLVLGNTALQIPIGWLADHLPRRRMILICAVIAAVGSFVLPAVIASPVLLWPLLFVTGAFSYGVFTLALAELGDRYSGSLLLAGNAAFALMWGVGGLIGPPTVGAAMNFIDPEGFPITLGLSYAILTALIVTTMIRTKRAS
jgi:MFS family permease